MDNNGFLLKLAKRTIQNYLETQQVLIFDPDDLPSKTFLEKRGVFVTLTKDGELRGCIGNLEPRLPIYQAVIENSLAAAFCDPRFPALAKDELEEIEIEISILSPLKKIPKMPSLKLLTYLEKNKPGLVLKLGKQSATFLPQVWEELTQPEKFLTHLSLKAGLELNSWQDSQTELYEYQVKIIK